MWLKKLSLVLVLLGISVVAYNFYTLTQGFLAYSEPNITENDFEIDEEIPIVEDSSREQFMQKAVPKIGEKIGDLIIPKLDRALPIYHGTTKEVLKKGVGHYVGSVLPGENNNSVLSGHRDTVFRGLGDVGVNDTLIVSTETGEFLYKVKKVRIVDKDDRTVIVPKPTSTLTLTTCYPFGFVGNAPQRYVLIGELISRK